jgi:tetratricopeptide (TPR) repeat protein
MAEAQILCTKCGAASAEPRMECGNCGSRNARVCGACGNQNSVSKNFCDKCGRSIAALGAIAPPPKTRLPGEVISEIPSTVIKHLAPGATSGPALPPFGQPPRSASNASLDDLWSAPPPPQSPVIIVPDPPRSRWRQALNVLAALAGAAAAAYAIWFWRESRRPEVLVPKLAAEYLEALRTRDYDRAYAMFSAAARANCTVDEFRASRDETTWTWANLRIDHTEPGAILLTYALKAGGAPPRQDHVLFTLEAAPDGNRWTRPYNWTLMRQVEAAFDKGDAEKGLILAQTAATINPRDPMAWGYLCEAAYYRKSPVDAELRCVRALELARTYPSNLTLKSLYHLHAILADTYHHALRKPDRALEQYAEMLSFPGISPADQCTILLARSSAYVDISRPGEALADVNRGLQLCTDPQDLAYIEKMRESLKAPDAP